MLPAQETRWTGPRRIVLSSPETALDCMVDDGGLGNECLCVCLCADRSWSPLADLDLLFPRTLSISGSSLGRAEPNLGAEPAPGPRKRTLRPPSSAHHPSPPPLPACHGRIRSCAGQGSLVLRHERSHPARERGESALRPSERTRSCMHGQPSRPPANTRPPPGRGVRGDRDHGLPV